MDGLYDIDETPVCQLPSSQYDIQRAKMFLMEHDESGDCLYDHLSELLTKILSERPKNAVDQFENYSKKLKDKRLKVKSNLQDIYQAPTEYALAEKLIKLFQVQTDVNEPVVGDDYDKGISAPPDLTDLFYHLEMIDVGLPKDHIVLLNLSIRRLIKEKHIQNIRLWGKILGRLKNYYIVEAELTADELARRQQLELDGSDGEMMRAVDENEGNVDDYEERSTLESSALPADETGTVIPIEQIGTGLNKKVYFVCNEPGLDDWIELPSVTPQQIIISKKIVRCFTGCLETPINTFLSFPGTEKNYLRSQIARITATTSVSPLGFMKFGAENDEEVDDEEEINEEDEEDTEGRAIRINPDYDPLPPSELIEPSLSNWCHHTDYILSQGRATYWGLAEVQSEEELGEEEEEENEEDKMEKKGERGPGLLTPLSEDALIDGIPAWTARLSSKIQEDTALAVLRSNLWPGAIAFTRDKHFGNFYVGNGLKFSTKSFAPPLIPLIQEQYRIGPEVMEMQEPSYEAEEAYRIAHLPPTIVADDGNDDAGDEGESDDEDEDDDKVEDDSLEEK